MGASDTQTTNQRLSEADRQTLLQVARESLEGFFRGGEFFQPKTDSPALLEKGAAFVTLRRRGTGELRGCRGEAEARRPLIESVAYAAIASAVDDPRFLPVTEEELPLLQIEINALTPMQPIQPEEVEVGKHGLLIEMGFSLGLLLPEVPVSQGWDRETYLQAVCYKAGLPGEAWKAEGAKLYGFEAEAWGEGDDGRLTIDD